MFEIRRRLRAVALLCASGVCLAQDFPRAPANVAAAEAAGLHRVDTQTLQRAYGGKRLVRTDKNDRIRLELRADGTLDYADDNGVTDSGSWGVLDRNGGTLCRRFAKQMGGRTCFIYFAAPDGIYWFGYSPDSGQWRDTTRAAPE